MSWGTGEHGTPPTEDVERITELLRRVGLGDRLRNRPTMLSGGEAQRTAIVRALANQPRLVLADEPTGNLDSKTTADVYALLRELNQETGVAFVMVTHNDGLAAQADRLLRIEDGYLLEGACKLPARAPVSEINGPFLTRSGERDMMYVPRSVRCGCVRRARASVGACRVSVPRASQC